MAGDTRHVLLFGLHVTDDARYRRYREEMLPFLRRHGGAFGYDFVVSRTLASETDLAINRVFTIAFPERERAAALFSDPGYLAVRRAWFEPSVATITQISAFDEPVPDRRAAT
jgi:uncharacterized protein (DUF1330 family)